ncbi:MAG TPA: universal stress protein [Luteibacter sp.]|uniref:universal stress protein n=1 Tax=Luteibacter sp. TaxID=1886636 RepID=UPI002CAC66D4|nr:universal stress protein [Luteibacter sp.]HVI55964.1 universal stress protein [Luteibacter sp.]
MFKHILIPTDGTAASSKAARIAVEFARRCGAQVSALHVVEPLPVRSHHGGVATATEIDRIVATQQATALYLSHVEELARAVGVPCASAEITDAVPSHAIVEFANRNGCDLIVMGTHGKHGLKRLILGSQTQNVLLTGHLPVLVCP